MNVPPRKPRISDEPLTVYSADSIPEHARNDLRRGVQKVDLWWGMATFDIRQRFKRSLLGPLWLTLSMAIMVITLGSVFGILLQQNGTELMAYIATGMIFWGLMTGTIVDSCNAFVAAEGYVRNVPMPLSTHLLRVFARNFLIFVFNLAIYVAVWLLFIRSVNINYLLFIPGALLFAANVAWFSVILAIICTRFRDIPQIVISAVQVVFFLTPVFWSADSLPERPAFVHFNPLHHMLEVVRQPLLGQAPSFESWLVLAGMLVVGVPFAIWLFQRFYARISYWI